ncbi:MAG: hypothetical protein B7X39_01180 [Lysobacterales bacterium 14-68-21]|jgi:TonB-dependent receptor|nr:MAG: hypothetical protein B7X45_02180 [Xanthomonadales bacterium 15-68-25]OZB68493.1 MAG: hypothetical protein B7X39_01180 [Xanthomonadales bacterium 14-68-21]
MKQVANTPRKRLIASAVLLALTGSMAAQAATPAQDTSSATSDGAAKQAANAREKAKADQKNAANLQAVVVKGIIGSLEQSANIKRYSDGIVDGIVAEDIGKFPDTNLAESIQRIPGVSIDRVNGEGARVTVRGIGPQFNLVLLNGRQMPTANINDTSASTDRSFDFAQLSSSAVSEIDVYKTGAASTPPGGMGATINIQTARPLDRPGTHGAVQVQGVWDESANNTPSSLKYGSATAPRINGIFSTTSADGEWGFGINGSYEKRNFGYNSAFVDGWQTYRDNVPYGGSWGGGVVPPAPDSVNAPKAGSDYAFPQALRYQLNAGQSTRVNGQMVLQFKPSDNLVNTLDYTYSQYKIKNRYQQLSAWFASGYPNYSAWTDGPIAAPLVYSETYSTPQDLDMAAGDSASKQTLNSIGWNTKWKVTDRLSFTFDAAHSTAKNGPDSPFGNSSTLDAVAFVRGTTTANFSGSFPILTNVYAPSGTQLSPSQMLFTGASFRNSRMKNTIDQIHLDGKFLFSDESELNFGVASTKVRNRTAYNFAQENYWGGIPGTSPADYADSMFHPDTMGQYFDQFSGHSSPSFTDQFFLWNFAQGAAAAQKAWDANAGTLGAFTFAAPTNYTGPNATDERTTEKSKSAYVSWDQTYYVADQPLSVSVGVRYEKTDVTSSALVPTWTGVSWAAANELYLVSSGTSGFTTLKGSYKYFLPAFNAAYNITDDMKVRAAYSETIGRPNWGDISGGQLLTSTVRVGGGTGSSGNPGLKPLLSHNFDLSWAWYYGKGSYVSVDYFRKNISNYIGTRQVTATPFNLPTPIGGAYYNEAVSTGGCATNDAVCIRDYILTNLSGQPGVDPATGTITGQPGDPVTQFTISEPYNANKKSLHGWEFSLQQMLGDTGFGTQLNYTIVQSPLHYDNFSYGQQSFLVGLSDSANFVGFYEKGAWQARVAYNWRGKFLTATNDSLGIVNPIYTAPYGQWDLSASYKINDNLSVSLDGINVTNRTQRLYTRNIHELIYLAQTGPRYMFGVQYKF